MADYFEHCLASSRYRPIVSFSSRSVWDPSCPWPELGFSDPQEDGSAYEPDTADALFIAGADWEQLDRTGAAFNCPIMNLVQHVRHADPSLGLYRFLSRRAVRVCVSSEVAAAIKATGQVNGPVYTIPNGLRIPATDLERDQDVCVLATKDPQLGKRVEQGLVDQGYRVSLVDRQVDRDRVLADMARSRVTVALPNPTEGFYLPALEAMALSDLCIVPDCVGNRSFCHHGQNCLMPAYDYQSIMQETERGLKLTGSGLRSALTGFRRARSVRKTLQQHSLERERRDFLHILDELDQMW